MAQFDPGPPPEVADHFDNVPSYAPTGICSGTTGGRSSIAGDSTARPGCLRRLRSRSNGTDSRSHTRRGRWPTCPRLHQQAWPDSQLWVVNAYAYACCRHDQ